MNKTELLALLNDPTAPKLTGQHLSYYPGDYTAGYQSLMAPLQTAYGKMPLMPGLTVGLGATAAECKAALDYLQARGFTVVMFDHHPNNPWTGGDPWDCRQADLAHLSACPAWQSELQKLREVFLYAKALGIVGLWRPFHEANSDGSFWWDWGTAGQTCAPFKAAWHDLRAYLDNAGVDNLVWMYSLLDMGWTDIYRDLAPAAAEFDAVGLDLYNNAATIAKDGYAVLTGMDKPFGFSEAGPSVGSMSALDWLSACKTRYPLTRFISFWHDFGTVKAALVDMSSPGSLLNDSAFLTTAGTTAPPVTPTATISATVKRWLAWWKVTLTWQTTNATGAVLNGKSVAFSGSQTRYVSRGTYDYVLVATRGSEAVSATVTVTAK